MKNIKLASTFIGLLLLSLPVMAVKIYECVDEEGNSTWQDTCPAGTNIAGEKRFNTGSTKSEAQPDVAITLYTTPACDACDVVKNILSKYNASFTEKNVESDVELQRELQEKSGGGNSLSVPTAIIGDDVIIGYNKQALTSSLEEAGFKSADAEAAPESAPPATAAAPTESTTTETTPVSE